MEDEGQGEPRKGAMKNQPRVGLLWLATLEYGPFVLAAVLLLLTSFADDVPSIQHLFPATKVGVYVCLTFVALFAFVLRLTDRIGSLERTVRQSLALQQDFVAAAKPPISLVPLAQAFRAAESTVGESGLVRIYAFSSRFISQHMQPRDFTVGSMCLLTSGAGPTTDSMLDMEIQLSVLYTWASRVRTGDINSLELRQYDFYPTEWYVIFDDKLMITSSYVHDVHSVGRVGTSPETFVVLPHGEGASLIRSKIESFDLLFAAAQSDFGPGKYEGCYELRDGVVKVRDLNEDAWRELSPVSQSVPVIKSSKDESSRL
ncbi:hypothetical protein [Cryptosporangium phraense]|uniref:Uncharacterized protein n=1 Tax=Cryptosporangium phraense TaxID=2593070 RepID=A0A545AR38_9ACTN|nr:hypothetical protein [Cryptosporangium phraense]TQS43800.1 hypothetical protein FL583_17390 [Cryptosporangium phraense]